MKKKRKKKKGEEAEIGACRANLVLPLLTSEFKAPDQRDLSGLPRLRRFLAVAQNEGKASLKLTQKLALPPFCEPCSLISQPFSLPVVSRGRSSFVPLLLFTGRFFHFPG